MAEQYVVIFDGVCNFCNGAVSFIIKRDHGNKFVFAPMQSPAAQRLIHQHGVTNVGFDTFLLIKNERCYLRTHAALEITKDLSGFWFLFRIFYVVPRPVRDYFYRLFARNRYRVFGKSERCMLPTEAVKNKFLWY